MKAQTGRRLRQLHRQIGLFFTPAILFFALSGAFQTLGWHENHGPGPRPAAWIAFMASIHKDQRLPQPRPDLGPAPGAHRPGPPAGAHRRPEPTGPSPVPMKIFVICLAIGLIGSSLLGALIALTARATRRGAILSLALGLVVPAALLFV